MAPSLPLHFHDVHNENITLSPDKTRASRLSFNIIYNNGFCFSNRPLEINEKLYFNCIKSSPSGEIHFGFTSQNPSTITANNLLSDIKPENLNLVGYCTKSLPYEYFKQDVVLSMHYMWNNDVIFCVNGEQKVSFRGITKTPVWAFVNFDCTGYVQLKRKAEQDGKSSKEDGGIWNSRMIGRGRTNSRARSSAPKTRKAQQDGNSSQDDIGKLVQAMTTIGAGWQDEVTKMDDPGFPEMICSNFLIGRCSSGKCEQIHYSLPYQWQYLDAVNCNWVDFSPRINCIMEECYCNPDSNGLMDYIKNYEKSSRDLFIVEFDSMILNFRDSAVSKDSSKVRRISTQNIITAPVALPMLTTWCWHWQCENDVFLKYSNLDSTTLEKCFNDDKTRVIQLSLNEFKYEIDFSRMVQRNIQTGKDQRIRRRPNLYVDKAMVEAEKTRQSAMLEAKTKNKPIREQHGIHSSDLPAFWDYSVDTDEDYFRLVPIIKASSTFHEYEKIEVQFVDTMSRDRYRITSIHRIQNEDLYKGFQHYKTKMLRRASSDSVEERFLFHGTRKKYIDAICRQGFDFRVSGSTTGCLYGQGSYFAKKAVYSRHYTDSCQLFVARVLVGRYAKGESHYKRPPPIDPNKPLEEVYDSCVDDVKNPKIFVVFAIDQAYPEYLVQYQKIK